MLLGNLYELTMTILEYSHFTQYWFLALSIAGKAERETGFLTDSSRNT